MSGSTKSSVVNVLRSCVVECNNRERETYNVEYTEQAPGQAFDAPSTRLVIITYACKIWLFSDNNIVAPRKKWTRPKEYELIPVQPWTDGRAVDNSR